MSRMSTMRMRIMVFGTFDGLHQGHESFLRQAKKLGDHLTVVVGRDSNVKQYKGSKPRLDENTRLKSIESNVSVNKAVLGELDHDYMKIISKEKPDIICLGYDQHSYGLEDNLKQAKVPIRIIRLKAYMEHKYKSSIMKKNRF